MEIFQHLLGELFIENFFFPIVCLLMSEIRCMTFRFKSIFLYSFYAAINRLNHRCSFVMKVADMEQKLLGKYWHCRQLGRHRVASWIHRKLVV